MMKSGKFIGRNQSGSTLILVIVAVAFVGIMATLLLSLTTMNYQMKNIDQTAKANFYSAEIAMDEIKMGLQDMVAAEMTKAYELSLVQYTKETNEEARNNFLKVTFLNNMTVALDGTPTETDSKYSIGKFTKYLSGPAQVITPASDCILQKRENYLVLKNVEVKYKETNGYSTTIKTDIKVFAPSMDSKVDPINAYPSFGDFVFIADQMVEIKAATNNFLIDGSIYAGGTTQDITQNTMDTGGIVLKESAKATVTGNHKVITRADVVVENGSTLKIGEETKYANVWANNIRTRKPTGDSTEDAIMEICGNTYTKDDLVLDTNNSIVKLVGKYHGFNYATTADWEGDSVSIDSGRSSAIMINGMSSKLDLSKIKDFIVAGKAFISAKQAELKSGIQDVVIGESLTVKHNQIAYLVPSEYMAVGHNPMTKGELAAYPIDENSLYKGAVNITSEKLLPYLDTKRPYVTITPQTAYDGMGLTYFYLNFMSQEAANAYFRDYYRDNKDKINEYMKLYAPTSDSGILLPENAKRFSIAGNILAYDKDDKSSLIEPSPVVDIEDLDEKLKLEETNVFRMYTDLTQTLMEYANYKTENPDSVYRTLISSKEIPAAGIKKTVVKNDESITTDDYVVHIIDNASSLNPYVIDTKMQGLVVATGDVKVEKEFRGTIIAGGKIIVSGVSNFDVTADSKIIKAILDANDQEVNAYFKTYLSAFKTAGDGTMKVDFSKQLTYENWTKY